MDEPSFQEYFNKENKSIEFKVNNKCHLIFDPYNLSQYEIIQKTLLKYEKTIQERKDIYNTCRGLLN